MPFFLDVPHGRFLNRVTRFAGWCLSDEGQPSSSTRLLVNGCARFQLAPSQRPDVAGAFPDHPLALNAGFVGDLVVPSTCKRGDKVSIAIDIEFPAEHRRTIYSMEFSVAEPLAGWPIRHRSYELDAILQDPHTGQPIQLKNLDKWGSTSEMRCLIAGVPHFHAPPNLPAVRLNETGTTHPWGERSRQLIEELKIGQVFLDFGAGIKKAEDLAPNAVFVDAIHFPNIDIVSTTENLPLRNDSVDLVISQAVFEHLPNPFHSAKEIFRVLKPGGKVLIDTAFMQPFHADPSHYFNMTLEGLRRTMECFEILDLGIQPYQMPSDGLTMQLEAILPTMKPGPWRDRVDRLLHDLRKEGRDFDRDLGVIGQRMIAAGVFAIARKPRM